MKHIVWDFNGTLLCDLQLSVDADNAVFLQLGLPPITTDTYRRHMTIPVRDFYAALGIDLNVYTYETISRLWLHIFNAGAIDAGLVPGTLSLVRTLYEAGRSQSVLSASYEPSLRAQCDALGLTPFMRAVNGLQNENAERKTAIGMRQLACLGLTGKDAVLVGDTASDAHLAAALGASCVLVSWGHNSTDRLLRCGCPVAETVEQLQSILERTG